MLRKMNLSKATVTLELLIFQPLKKEKIHIYLFLFLCDVSL